MITSDDKFNKEEEGIRYSRSSFSPTIKSQISLIFYQIVWHLEGTIIINFVSSGVKNLLNITPEEIISNPYNLLNYIHPEDQGKVKQIFKNIVELPRTEDFKCRWLRNEDEVIYLDNKIQFLKTDENKIIIEGICQENLVKNLIFLESLEYKILEKLPNFFYLYELQKQEYLYINSSLSQLLGYENPPPLLANITQWTQLIHSEDRDRLTDAYRQCLTLKDQDQVTLEYRLKNAQGQWCWLNSTLKIFTRTSHGSPQQIIATAQDITPYQAIKSRLRRQKGGEKLLNSIATRIHQSLELDAILKISIKEMRQFLHIDRLLIYRFKPDWSGVVTFESVVSPWRSLLGRILLDEEFIAHYLPKYKTGRIHLIPDLENSELSSCHIQWLTELQVKANLVIPIVQGQELWGLLVAQHCRSPRYWEDWEIHCLKHFSLYIGIALEQEQLYRELRLANEELEQLAFVDSLTEVANRRRFDEYLQQEWRRLTRAKQPLSLIVCDVDFFKFYNDTYGHPAGDKCLQQVAQVLQQSVKRPADLVARHGGEEFAIVLPNTDISGAVHIAGEVRSRLRGLKLEHRSSLVSDYVTLSFGIATTYPTPQTVVENLLIDADLALYQAKGQGRDRIFVNQ